MTIEFISIDTHRVSKEFLSEKIDINKLTKNTRAIVYAIEDDIYFLSTIPTVHLIGNNRELICNTKEEFIQKVREHKLLKLLD